MTYSSEVIQNAVSEYHGELGPYQLLDCSEVVKQWEFIYSKAWLLYSKAWLLYSKAWLLYSKAWLLYSKAWLLYSKAWLLYS